MTASTQSSAGVRPPSANLLAALTLCQRDAVHFLRQRSRVAGALGTPLIFWLLLGFGLGKSFHPPDAAGPVHYLEYFFPGTLVMILLFSAIFSTYSVIEDRRAGFLQAVLVSPAARWSIVLGKLLGGAVPAWAQGMLFLALAPLSGLPLSAAQVAALAGVVFLIAFGMTGLGFMFAWSMDSAQGFHAIMNLLLLPLWLLSGALFPPAGAPAWLQWVMAVNPVTYAVATVRGILYAGGAPAPGGSPGIAISLVVVAVFATATFLVSAAVARRTRTGN